MSEHKELAVGTPTPSGDEATSLLSDHGRESDYRAVACAEDGEPGAVLSFHDVQYNVREKMTLRRPWAQRGRKAVLKRISGIMKPGINAIMGPSGGGKTTLLDVLAGRRKPSNEDAVVLLNGSLLPDNYQLVSGYVIQDDVLMPTLTVRENLNFSASLRLPASNNQSQRKQRVNSLIHDLGLQLVADSKVGSRFDAEVSRGVSGGERKRTHIGMELVPAPTVLYLDEPTSGLDASTAVDVMQLLHKLSRKGQTIIVSIHQPRYSIVKLFDTLTLLNHGQIVYHGAASQLVPYFESLELNCEPYENPLDVFMDIIRSPNVSLHGHSGKTSTATFLADNYEKSAIAKTVAAEISSVVGNYRSSSGDTKVARLGQSASYQTGFVRQFGVVCHRTLINFVRAPTAMAAQVALSVVLGLVVGIVFYKLDSNSESAMQDRSGALFLMTMIMAFVNVPAVELFLKDRALFTHESASGYYRTSSYFLARVLCDLVPMRIIPASLVSLIAYWMVGFSPDIVKFAYFVLNCLTTTLASCGLAFLVSAFISIQTVAILVLSVIFLIMMVFAGLLINLNTLSVSISWLQWVSIMRYGFEAFCINEFAGKVYCQELNGTCVSNSSGMYLGDEYLKSQGFSASHRWRTQGALAAILFGLFILSYLRLRFSKKVT